MTKRFVRACLVALMLASASRAYALYFDFEQITVDNTAGGKGFTAAKISPTNKPFVTVAQCRLETAEIRYLYVDPAVTAVTASVGTLLEPGELLTVTSREQILNFRAIRTGVTSGQLDCHYTSPAP